MSTDRRIPPPDRLWQPVTMKWFAAVFGVSLGYAVLRYHIVGTVPWQQFPLFILNKAVSLAAVFFIGASYLVGKVIRWHDHDKRQRLVVIKFCGLMGFCLACIHGLMSLALLRPAYFAKYFQDDGRLNVEGGFAMTVGILALLFLVSPAVASPSFMAKELGGWRWKRAQRLGYVALALVVVHLLFLGIKGWLNPGHWPGGLLPISLIAFVGALVPLIVKRQLIYSRRQQRNARDSAGEDSD